MAKRIDVHDTLFEPADQQKTALPPFPPPTAASLVLPATPVARAQHLDVHAQEKDRRHEQKRRYPK